MVEVILFQSLMLLSTVSFRILTFYVVLGLLTMKSSAGVGMKMERIISDRPTDRPTEGLWNAKTDSVG
jgi:hypothetical protein